MHILLSQAAVEGRVLTNVSLDLWGRGYSDTPHDLPQDTRLFSSAILLALASSDLCWTGPSPFTLVGYSLGGGIAANFTSFFPYLVSCLILIAPSGLVRKEHISKTSKLLYSTGLLPEFLIESLVKKRLGGHSSAAVVVKSKQRVTAGMPVEQELPSREQAQEDSGDVLSGAQPELNARGAVVSRAAPDLSLRMPMTS